METNIFYRLALALSKKGEDLESVASEMAKALARIIEEENRKIEKEFIRLVRM